MLSAFCFLQRMQSAFDNLALSLYKSAVVSYNFFKECCDVTSIMVEGSMEGKELLDILRKYPDTIEDQKRLMGILKDYFPTERQNIRLLEQALEVNILQEIHTKHLDKPLQLRLRKRLMDEFFLQQDKADWAVFMWSYAYGYGVLGKVMPSLEEQSKPQPAKPAPQAVQKRAAGNIPPAEPKTGKTAINPKTEDVRTLYLRGQQFLSGKDNVQAARLFRRAADLGYAEAQNCLGWCYENGIGVAQDSIQATIWYRKAAEQGRTDAQEALARYYYNHWDEKVDDAQMVVWFRKLAEREEPFAQDGLARCYYDGRGVERDYAQAVKWWRKATEGKYPNIKAAFRLAECYEKGAGVQQDYALALEYYQIAAKQDGNHYCEEYKYCVEAQYRLGIFYFDGRGVKRDYAQAVKWWHRTTGGKYKHIFWCESYPHSQAIFRLGMCYENGLGVEQNFGLARECYQNIARRGHAQAAFQLAALYEMGKCAKKDKRALNRAAELYRKAEEQGVDGAQEALERVEKKIRWGLLAFLH